MCGEENKSQASLFETAMHNTKTMIICNGELIDPEDYDWEGEHKYDEKNKSWFYEMTGTLKNNECKNDASGISI